MKCFRDFPGSVDDPQCLMMFGAMAVFFLITCGIPIWKAIAKRLKELSTFELFFVDHEPPNENVVNYGFAHSIPLGQSNQHWVKIICNRGINLKEFGFRFIPEEDVRKDSRAQPSDIHSIIMIRDVHILSDDLAPNGVLSTHIDRYGGIIGKLTNPVSRGVGKALFFRLDITANQQWSGLLSFESMDQDMHMRNAQHAVITEDKGELSADVELPSFHEGLGQFIPMKEAATAAYEQLRECGSVYAWAAEELGPSPTESREEGTLGWFVYFLASRISLFGKFIPSRKLELINPQEFKRGGFNNLGQSFSYYGKKEPRYMDLMVKRSDLNKLIESLRHEKCE